MTQPNTELQSSTPDLSPAEILLNLIVILLAPIFLPAAGADIRLAQLAAIETINEYRACNNAGLLAVAQIVAFGLAALGSLSLSMQDDISIPMTLRLRSNANALNRSAEQNRRVLASLDYAPQNTTMTEADHRQEAAVIAGVEAAQAAVSQAGRPPQAQSNQPQPIQPTPAQTGTETMPDQEKQRRAIWANAMAEVASEYTASLPFLPPAERKVASLKASAMTASITALLSGDPLPRLMRDALSPSIPPR